MKILIISDIHGNLAALQAVLDAEPQADLTVCLGDLVDYGPQPAECVALVRQCVQAVVMGNHDHAVGHHADPGCSPAYEHLAQVTRDYSIGVLGREASHYLATLPLRGHFERGGAQFCAVHAAPSDPLFKYLPPDSPEREWESEAAFAHHPDVLLLGHTHLPLVKSVDTTTVVNPGSVGQPKGGDPRAAYAVWEDGEISLRQAAYDLWQTADAFTKTDLLPGDVVRLVAILRSGGSAGP